MDAFLLCLPTVCHGSTAKGLRVKQSLMIVGAFVLSFQAHASNQIEIQCTNESSSVTATIIPDFALSNLGTATNCTLQ